MQFAEVFRSACHRQATATAISFLRAAERRSSCNRRARPNLQWYLMGKTYHACVLQPQFLRWQLRSQLQPHHRAIGLRKGPPLPKTLDACGGHAIVTQSNALCIFTLGVHPPRHNIRKARKQSPCARWRYRNTALLIAMCMLTATAALYGVAIKCDAFALIVQS